MDQVIEDETLAGRTEPADIGLLILRVLLGMIFLGHGLQKFGLFPGGGYPTSLEEQRAFLELFGYHSVGFLAWVITLTELGTGASLIFGFLTPLGAAGAIGIAWQFIAGLQWSGGLFGNETVGGYENSLAMLAIGVLLAFAGPGRLSLDHTLGWKFVGTRWALGSIALGIVVGSIVLVAFGVGFGGTPFPPGG
jgi:putative oxidoreductase